ncbi:hypothetical protein D3C79_955630 [compost metagenome]
MLQVADTDSLGSEFTFASALVNSASIEGMSLPLIKSDKERLGAELPSDTMPPLI